MLSLAPGPYKVGVESVLVMLLGLSLPLDGVITNAPPLPESATCTPLTPVTECIQRQPRDLNEAGNPFIDFVLSRKLHACAARVIPGDSRTETAYVRISECLW